MGPNDIDFERFQFEKEKHEKEILLREREIAVREQEAKNNRSKSSTRITIWVAVFGLLGSGIVSLIQSYSNLVLERKRFESEIVLKVATSDSLERNKKNLEFMLKAGFITDEDGKIDKLMKDSSFDLKITTGGSESVIDLPVKSPGQVYICRIGTSYAYHDKLCQALKRCSHKIVAVTIKQAEQLGHTKQCAFCYGAAYR